MSHFIWLSHIYKLNCLALTFWKWKFKVTRKVHPFNNKKNVCVAFKLCTPFCYFFFCFWRKNKWFWKILWISIVRNKWKSFHLIWRLKWLSSSQNENSKTDWIEFGKRWKINIPFHSCLIHQNKRAMLNTRFNYSLIALNNAKL